MKKKILLLIALFCFTPLFAHECWVAAKKFVLQKGETAELSLHVGENFEPEIWKGKIENLTYFFDKQQKNILPLLQDTTKQQFSLPTQGEGTQLIALHSADKYITLESAKFNDYLKEDGLLDVLEFRKKNNQIDSFGTELYQRCNKILLQVGNKKTETYKQVVGTRLEILPQQNPYNKPAKLTIKILFDNKPLANNLVVLWQRINGKTLKTTQISDKKGLVIFSPTYQGNCMISTVKMVENENQAKAQWHSYWANLTFGL
jgi:uncharacterized GH25 family protein